MGFADVEGLYRDGRGLRERLKLEEPLTARDWGRALLATELCFASSFGSTIDWETTTGIRHAEAIALLRSLQHKLGGMAKQVAVPSQVLAGRGPDRAGARKGRQREDQQWEVDSKPNASW